MSISKAHKLGCRYEMLLQSLETNTLIDMLSEETGKYIGMLHATSVDANEFYRCRLLIKELQREIETRKHISPLAEINKEKTSGQ